LFILEIRIRKAYLFPQKKLLVENRGILEHELNKKTKESTKSRHEIRNPFINGKQLKRAPCLTMFKQHLIQIPFFDFTNFLNSIERDTRPLQSGF
jgi:hypothetical protein